jgi:hypothetical protein
MAKKDIVRCLSEPRELCKTCYNWLTQEDVGPNDFPHCGESVCESCRGYLLGRFDNCRRYLNQ